MKRSLTLSLLAMFALSLVFEEAIAKKMTPKKGAWIDLQTNGVLFGTIAEASPKKGRKSSVTYYIRKKDGIQKPEKLVSKKGLFAFSLIPGRYEIYDWSLSGKGHKSQDHYEFEIRAGHLTYIGRIVTDIIESENKDGPSRPKNHPYISDQRQYDATLFANIYPVFANLKIILSVKDRFVWN